MSIGLYVHIPFCLQQCPYCDFATQANNEALYQDYCQSLRLEIQSKAHWCSDKEVASLYFGGGTPSLLPPSLMLTLIQEFEKQGFRFLPDCERSLEINPGTLDENSLAEWLAIGINRFSVGAQSFHPELLKQIGRKHSPADTVETLSLLNAQNLNYSFDLLFSLPGQSLAHLDHDLEQIARFRPKHLSAYYLTIPSQHSLQRGRPNETTELQMFDRIERQLHKLGYQHYEISNFAQPGFISQHNYRCWKGDKYLGIGMSAHSYLWQDQQAFRFWNPNSTTAWQRQLTQLPKPCKIEDLGNNQFEILSDTDRINDALHTGLRLVEGFRLQEQLDMATADQLDQIRKQCESLRQLGYLHKGEKIRLRKKGRRNLNYVLERLFLSESQRMAGSEERI